MRRGNKPLPVVRILDKFGHPPAPVHGPLVHVVPSRLQYVDFVLSSPDTPASGLCHIRPCSCSMPFPPYAPRPHSLNLASITFFGSSWLPDASFHAQMLQSDKTGSSGDAGSFVSVALFWGVLRIYCVHDDSSFLLPSPLSSRSYLVMRRRTCSSATPRRSIGNSPGEGNPRCPCSPRQFATTAVVVRHLSLLLSCRCGCQSCPPGIAGSTFPSSFSVCSRRCLW